MPGRGELRLSVHGLLHEVALAELLLHLRLLQAVLWGVPGKLRALVAGFFTCSALAAFGTGRSAPGGAEQR